MFAYLTIAFFIWWILCMIPMMALGNNKMTILNIAKKIGKSSQVFLASFEILPYTYKY